MDGRRQAGENSHADDGEGAAAGAIAAAEDGAVDAARLVEAAAADAAVLLPCVWNSF